MSRRFSLCLAAACSLRLAAIAHPVTQGALEVTVGSEAVMVQARVSNEEAFVAAAYGKLAPGNTTELWRQHGDYLCAHLRVEADGRTLAGEVDAVTSPATPSPTDFIVYQLRYFLPEGQRGDPRSVMLRQDVLNEFTFAPGNPWEATYVVRIIAGQKVWREGLLFTRHEPLEFHRREGTPGAGPDVPPLNRVAMARTFLRNGVGHILGGYDHLLFVAGLVLATATLWDLCKVVLVFTVAHSVTLTLAALNVVRVSERLVEPVIAASIVFVAIQNILAPRQSHGRERLAVAFGFGLFHGLGYAGGLLGAMQGMSAATVALAIASFSVGVEVGHQIVALSLFAGLHAFQPEGGHPVEGRREPGKVTRRLSGGIALAGVFYLAAALRTI